MKSSFYSWIYSNTPPLNRLNSIAGLLVLATATSKILKTKRLASPPSIFQPSVPPTAKTAAYSSNKGKFPSAVQSGNFPLLEKQLSNYSKI